MSPYGELENYALLPAVVHVFTHFRLHIIPYRVRLSGRVPMAAQDGHVWVAATALPQAPLPAPIRKLLQGMGEL